TKCPSKMRYYFYNCPSDLNLPQPLYLLFNEMVFRDNDDFSGEGGTVYEKDGYYVLVYSASYGELQTAVCRATSEYSYRNFGYTETDATSDTSYSLKDGIRVMTDLRSDEGGTIVYDFEVLLEDGSLTSGAVYECYPLVWTSCFSNGKKISDGVQSYNIRQGYADYPDVNPLTISRLLKKGVDVNFGIGDADTAHPYYYMEVSRPLDVPAMSLKYVCTGECLTYVNGIKRDPVRYYTEYSETINYEGITYVSRGNITKDIMYSGFTSIFNTLYNDSDSWFGNAKKWQHHAHPKLATLTPVLDLPTGIDSQPMYNFTFESSDVTYDNSGYSPTHDSNPYTVGTRLDMKTMHDRLPYGMIVFR
ncbi:MAG: hypothetical protein ACI39U_02530, partial [Candidatus Cryptobacteroides sp.]